MKLFNLLILIAIFSTSCSSQEVSDDLIVIYNASTRGSNILFKINSEIIEKDENGTMVRTKISSKKWKGIKDLINLLALEEINSYEAPSEKRFSDGALHADLSIIANTKTFNSQTFDHGNPPKELKELVEKLLSL